MKETNANTNERTNTANGLEPEREQTDPVERVCELQPIGDVVTRVLRDMRNVTG